MFGIRSVSSNREIVFTSHKGEYFHVELKGIEVSASTDVWATSDSNGLNTFFQEIAGFKNAWKGEKKWASRDGEFEISATCTTLGHVIFRVKLAGQVGGIEEWEVQVGLDTELGQLEKIAQNAKAFFQCISDDEKQKQATSPIVQSKWNPIAYAEMMKKSTSPPVSAFFLIDSLEAIHKCIQWLSNLKPYNMPDMENAQYFKDVRKIYEAGKVVMNFDYDFSLIWQGKEYPEKLRCHLVDKGQYEIELWLPGVVANEIADKFRDGHEGFFCSFMSHAFYD